MIGYSNFTINTYCPGVCRKPIALVILSADKNMILYLAETGKTKADLTKTNGDLRNFNVEIKSGNVDLTKTKSLKKESNSEEK